MSQDPLAKALMRLAFVRRRWRAVVAWTLLGAVAGAFLAWWVPVRYAATAGVVIQNTRLTTTFQVTAPAGSEAELAAAIVSSPQSAIQASPQLAASYLSSRRAMLVSLVSNESIAEAVLARLGKGAKPEDRIPGELVSKVEGTIAMGLQDKDRADLILITVRSRNAARSALLANLWAAEYAKLVNQTLGPSADLVPLRKRLDEARRRRDEADGALAAFLAESPIDELKRARSVVLASLEALCEARKAELRGGAPIEDGATAAAIRAQERRARELAAAIEREEARHAALVSARDRARADCQEIETRLARLPHETESAADEVRFVKKAAPPKEPIPPTPAQAAALAVLAGFLVGVAWAYVRQLVTPVHAGSPGAAEAPTDSPAPVTARA